MHRERPRARVHRQRELGRRPAASTQQRATALSCPNCSTHAAMAMRVFEA